jgi:hypothetical protein
MYHISALGITPCGYRTSEITKRPSYLWKVADLELALTKIKRSKYFAN